MTRTTSSKPRDEWDVVAPRPTALIESLRAVGYTLASALADVVDNSISAGAANVKIEAKWRGIDSYVAVLDDGRGMTESALVEAMRLGSRNPLDARDPKDLGRFGLGLKTASFSQCRSLTVESKAEGSPSAVRRWDLDTVARENAWTLLRDRGDRAPILPHLGNHGTIVLWQHLDRVVAAARADDAKARDRFLSHLQLAEHHLRVVFHKFLHGRSSIRIMFNDRDITPWDPFLRDHEATQHLPEEIIGRGPSSVKVQSFILPHVSRLTEALHKEAGGARGWTGQQGFYVYRGGRLLVDGDWLGLGMKKDEHSKLARVALELPNTADFEWAIDVKKSRAKPPDYLREDLCRIAEAARRTARDVYNHRGRVIARTYGAPELVWLRKVTGGKVSYVLNRDYPLLNAVLESAGISAARIRSLLRLVEETVPVHTIFAERAASEDPPFATGKSDLVAAAIDTYDALISAGLDSATALRRLLSLEPFNHHPGAIISALDQKPRGVESRE